MKKKIKTLLPHKPLLIETDLYEDDDPVTKKTFQQISQPTLSSNIINTVFSETIYQYFNDSHLSQS